MTTRRAHLATLGLTGAAPLVALAPRPALAGPVRAAPLELTARRTEITLPDLPVLGTPYICLLDLFDSSGEQVGEASTSSFVVALTVDGGPTVLSTVVLRLEAGEIHYQRQIRRHGPYPRESTGAVLGGAGEYAGAAGEVDVTWPDEETVELAVHLS